MRFFFETDTKFSIVLTGSVSGWDEVQQVLFFNNLSTTYILLFFKYNAKKHSLKKNNTEKIKSIYNLCSTIKIAEQTDFKEEKL